MDKVTLTGTTWARSAEELIAMLENEQGSGKEIAREEIARMGRLLDYFNSDVFKWASTKRGPVLKDVSKITNSLELLKQMRGCNWTNLAADLGVSPATLRSWRKLYNERQSPGKNACMRQHQLFHATLRTCDSDWISISFLNFDNIRSIGGRR